MARRYFTAYAPFLAKLAALPCISTRSQEATKRRVVGIELRQLGKYRQSLFFVAKSAVYESEVQSRRHLTGISIDNMAHLGGFSCGLLFAMPMVPRLGSPRPVFQARLGAAVAMIVGILVLFGFYLAKLAA